MKKILPIPLLSISIVLAACSSSPQMTQQEMQQHYTQQIDTHLQIFDQVFWGIWEEHYSETEIALEFSPKTKLQGMIAYSSQTQTKGQNEDGTITINANIKNFSNDLPLFITGTLETHLQDQSLFIKILNSYLFAWPGNDEIKFMNLLFQQLQGKWLALSTGEHAIISTIVTPTVPEIRQIMEYFLWNNQENRYDVSSAKLLLSFLIELFDLPIHGKIQDGELVSEIYTTKNKEVEKTSTYHYRTEFTTLDTEVKSSTNKIERVIKDVKDRESWTTSDFSLTIKLRKEKEKKYSIVLQKAEDHQFLLNLQGKLTLSKEGQQTRLVYDAEIVSTPLRLTQGEIIGMKIQGKTLLSPGIVIQPSFTGEILRLSDIIEGF